MSTLQFAWVVGFAGWLMLFAYCHTALLPLGGMFNRQAIPWLIGAAVLWPILLGLVLGLLALGMAAMRWLEKKKEQEDREKGPLKRGEVQPPYDGSLQKKRYWKKVRER